MKKILAKTTAFPEKLGPLDIVRALPNRATQGVGPVIFLDHVLEKSFAPNELPTPDGSFAHPHRGIATFSYLLQGEIMHFDSNGGHGLVKAGGVQWMNAGNGIIHDEMMPAEFRELGGDFHALQFWVNLPSKQKAEDPGYMPVSSDDLPVISLADGDVTLKVLLGEYQGEKSPIPTFSEQFIWHIQIKPGAELILPTITGHEYAAYLPAGRAIVNHGEASAKQFLLFGEDGDTIKIENPTREGLNLFLFGGEPYWEAMVSHGPFVMNSSAEIHQAYADHRAGKYGQIDYLGHLD